MVNYRALTANIHVCVCEIGFKCRAVHFSNIFAAVEYKGCYQDDGDRDLPLLENIGHSMNSQSCIAFCYERGKLIEIHVHYLPYLEQPSGGSPQETGYVTYGMPKLQIDSSYIYNLYNSAT